MTMELTSAQLDELCARSAAGEGVRAVLAEWGCDDTPTLESLKQHQARLKEAKAEYRRTGGEKA